jgi:hypothetical protein
MKSQGPALLSLRMAFTVQPLRCEQGNDMQE